MDRQGGMAPVCHELVRKLTPLSEPAVFVNMLGTTTQDH
jgi:hypothetical protein